jgi:hypothetical protein
MAGAENEEVVLNKTAVDMHEILLKTTAAFIQSSKLSSDSIRINLLAENHTINGDALHLGNIIYNLPTG